LQEEVVAPVQNQNLHWRTEAFWGSFQTEGDTPHISQMTNFIMKKRNNDPPANRGLFWVHSNPRLIWSKKNRKAKIEANCVVVEPGLNTRCLLAHPLPCPSLPRLHSTADFTKSNRRRSLLTSSWNEKDHRFQILGKKRQPGFLLRWRARVPRFARICI